MIKISFVFTIMMLFLVVELAHSSTDSCMSSEVSSKWLPLIQSSQKFEPCDEANQVRRFIFALEKMYSIEFGDHIVGLGRPWANRKVKDFLAPLIVKYKLEESCDAGIGAQAWISQKTMLICPLMFKYEDTDLMLSIIHEATHMDSRTLDHEQCFYGPTSASEEACDSELSTRNAYGNEVLFRHALLQTTFFSKSELAELYKSFILYLSRFNHLPTDWSRELIIESLDKKVFAFDGENFNFIQSLESKDKLVQIKGFTWLRKSDGRLLSYSYKTKNFSLTQEVPKVYKNIDLDIPFYYGQTMIWEIRKGQLQLTRRDENQPFTSYETKDLEVDEIFSTDKSIFYDQGIWAYSPKQGLCFLSKNSTYLRKDSLSYNCTESSTKKFARFDDHRDVVLSKSGILRLVTGSNSFIESALGKNIGIKNFYTHQIISEELSNDPIILKFDN